MAREEIWAFGEHHLDGCAELYASVFASTPWNEPWTAERARERLAEIYYAPAFEGFVCTVGGEFAGLAMGNSVRRAAGRGFYLHELCVRTEMQGAGVGKRLLARLEGRLRDAGVGSIFLVTGLGIPAAGFYAKNGYAEAPRMTAMVKTL